MNVKRTLKVMCSYFNLEECYITGVSSSTQREHVLTMRYGKEQLQLVRKRMKIEEWLFNSLEELFDDSVRCSTNLRTLLARAGQRLRT